MVFQPKLGWSQQNGSPRIRAKNTNSVGTQVISGGGGSAPIIVKYFSPIVKARIDFRHQDRHGTPILPRCLLKDEIRVHTDPLTFRTRAEAFPVTRGLFLFKGNTGPAPTRAGSLRVLFTCPG
jgi:hypothetical protein